MASATAPRRINAALLARAENAGTLFHRSGTQQLEHWALLGAAVETVLGFPSVAKLKALSQGPQLDALIRVAGTRAGNAKLARFLKSRSGRPVGLGPTGQLVRARAATGRK